jgi:hypothetical protein
MRGARFHSDVGSRSAGLFGQVYGPQGFHLGMGKSRFAMPSSANDFSIFDDYATYSGVGVRVAQASPSQNNGFVHKLFV